MKSTISYYILFTVLASFGFSDAFTPQKAFHHTIKTSSSSPNTIPLYWNSLHSQNLQHTQQNNLSTTPISLLKQRQSMAKVQTMGLFGLGGPEIVVILLAIGFVLGPQKIAELAKDLGKSAGDLKDIPIEFQKGFQEGQEEASKGQIAALSRGAGVKANDYKEELKEVPKEFKKGMEEAEDNVRAKKAKPMDMSD